MLLHGESGTRRYLAQLGLAELFAGFAAGMKYNAGICLLGVWVTHAIRKKREIWLWTGFTITALAAIGGFLLASPYAFFSFDVFITNFAEAVYIYTTELTRQASGGLGVNFVRFVSTMWNSSFGPVSMLILLGGIVWLAWKHWQVLAVLLAFIVPACYLNSNARTYAFRNYLPMIPLLSILYGAGVGALVELGQYVCQNRKQLVKIGIAGLVCISLVVPFSKSYRTAKDFQTKRDSRAMLMADLEKRFTTQDTIAIDEHLHVFLPERWSGPRILVTNVFNKPFQWFEERGIRHVVVAGKYDYYNPRHEEQVVMEWLNMRFASLETIASFGDQPLIFTTLPWSPRVELREFINYEEPARSPRVLPAVAMEANGRAFLTNFQKGVGVELWSKGSLSGTVELDTTVTKMRLCGTGYWKHPDHPRARVVARKASRDAQPQVLAEKVRFAGSGAYDIIEMPCLLAPGRWIITIEFVNGDDPLPLFEEAKARRLGLRLIEFVP